MSWDDLYWSRFCGFSEVDSFEFTTERIELGRIRGKYKKVHVL